MGVAHLYAAADALDVAVKVEGDEDFLYGVAVKRAVGVKMDYVFAGGMRRGEVGCTCLSAAEFEAEKLGYIACALQVVAYDRCRVVRAVVDDYYLEVLLGLLTQRLHEFVDVSALVFAGRED